MSTTAMSELHSLLALSTTPLLGPMKVRLLIQHFGSASAAWKSNPIHLKELTGFGQAIIDAFSHAQKAESWRRELEAIEKYGARLIDYTHPEYPEGLKQLNDAPLLLYVLGTLEAKDHNSLAVIGTRNASIYGQEMTHRFSHDLCQLGYTVVSGLARGIDTCAHRGALSAAGRTLAVIGSGLANIYPRENLRLAQEISQSGALISEFPMKTPPDRQNFPQRNRIVAAMTRGTVLMEAPSKSGGMLTCGLAQRYKRPVFAIPGRADVSYFKGNHSLIKEGKARLVESASDVATALDNLFPLQGKGFTKNPPTIHLESKEQELLDAMPETEATVDELLEKTKLPITKLNVLLMSLVIKKVIKELPGKTYKKNM